ncbi:MAG TPA: hypothetical protein V6C84_15835, partial [Coleofasciculaceae cyanobacterium]
GLGRSSKTAKQFTLRFDELGCRRNLISDRHHPPSVEPPFLLFQQALTSNAFTFIGIRAPAWQFKLFVCHREFSELAKPIQAVVQSQSQKNSRSLSSFLCLIRYIS